MTVVPPPVMVSPPGRGVVVVAPGGSRLGAFLGYWIGYGVMMLMPVGLFVYAMYVWVPGAREMFMAFKTPLPSLTQWVLETSASVNTMTFWVEAGLTVGLLSAVLAGFTVLMPRGFMRAAVAMVSMLIILGLTVGESVFLYWAIWDPLLKLIRHVSGGAA